MIVALGTPPLHATAQNRYLPEPGGAQHLGGLCRPFVGAADGNDGSLARRFQLRHAAR